MPMPDLLTEKSKGLMFRPEMVKAILEGRKTQTRRINTTLKRGDLAYVKETWAWVDMLGIYVYRASSDDGAVILGEKSFCIPSKWKSPMMMPRKAARIWLRVLDVRKERLRDITNADSQAEGFSWGNGMSAVEAFAAYWNTINRDPGTRWEDDPEVYVNTFERVA